MKEIAPYQDKVSRVYKVDVYLIHALAVSRFGLGAIVLTEYLRNKGYPFPDTLKTVNRLTHFHKFSESLVFKHKDDTNRHKLMENLTKDK